MDIPAPRSGLSVGPHAIKGANRAGKGRRVSSPRISAPVQLHRLQSGDPSALIPGAKIDQELNAVKQTSDAVRANMALIPRDDGALANDSVGVDQRKPEVTLSLSAVADWVSGDDYVPNNGAWYAGKPYRCLIGHTSKRTGCALSPGAKGSRA